MSTTVLPYVISKIQDVLTQEAVKLHGFPGHMRWIKQELEEMQSFLQDADASSGQDNGVELWVKRIREAAYDAEDIIDLYVYDRIRHDLKGKAKRILHVGEHSVSTKIESLREKINTIKLAKQSYGTSNLSHGGRGEPQREIFVPEYVEEKNVVGFLDARVSIIGQLLDSSITNSCVVSIVGAGGLGKTTVARRAYNFSKVQGHFDAQIWLNVSQVKSAEDVADKIVEAIMSEMSPDEGSNSLQKKLSVLLKPKRYLIVLDHVHQGDLWQRLREVLPDAENGSRVLLTTRFLDIAKAASTIFEPHQLRLLNEEESTELLLKKALPHDQRVPGELQNLVPQFLRKCAGLPLALVVLGELLWTSGTAYNAWRRVLDTFTWHSMGETFMQVLSSSYQELSYELKSCFIYLATFPKDYEIPASILLKLWIAEGFIPSQESERYEEHAENYLEKLVDKSLVKVVERKYNGTIKTCRVHELLHVMAISEAEKNGIILTINRSPSTATYWVTGRRLALHCEVNDDIKSLSLRNLRSLAAFGPSIWPNFEHIDFRLLKVLELSEVVNLKSLPHEITNLVLLKYLGLRHTGLRDLPRAINELANLQTLDLKGTNITKPSRKLWKIESLRHVRFSLNTANAPAPPRSAHLKYLRTLIGISITSFQDMIAMANLTNLRKLKFYMLDDTNIHLLPILLTNLKDLVSLRVQAKEITFTPHCTFAHPILQSLYLHGEWTRPSMEPHSQWPGNLELPECLTKLTLNNTQLEEDPMPRLEKLRNLKVLTLDSAYVGERMLCSGDGGFPELRKLTLKNLHHLKEWLLYFSSMAQLSHLHIDSCENLEMLPELQHVINLEKLTLVSMPDDFRLMVEDNSYRIQSSVSIVYKKDSSAPAVFIKSP